MERAVGGFPLGRIGLGQRQVGGRQPVGVEARVELLDAIQVHLDQLARAHLVAAHRRSLLKR
jgi:hypothetical protein